MKHLPADAAEMQETPVQSLGWENPLEKEMAIRSCISCLENSKERTGGLAGYSPGGHKESDTTRACTHMARLGEMKNLGRAAEVK